MGTEATGKCQAHRVTLMKIARPLPSLTHSLLYVFPQPLAPYNPVYIISSYYCLSPLIERKLGTGRDFYCFAYWGNPVTETISGTSYALNKD